VRFFDLKPEHPPLAATQAVHQCDYSGRYYGIIIVAGKKMDIQNVYALIRTNPVFHVILQIGFKGLK
jgi:hypothetical protein